MKNLRKLLVISNEQLMCVGSAGTTVMCGLVEEALSNKWDVTHLALIEKSSEEVSAQKSEKFRCQNDENLEEHFVFYEKQPVSGFKKLVASFDAHVASHIGQLSKSLLSNHFDRVIAFDSLAIGLAPNFKGEDRYYILGDPAGWKIFHSAMFFDFRHKILGLILMMFEPLYWRLKLVRPSKVFIFGAMHCKFFSRFMKAKITDIRPFMPRFVMTYNLQIENLRKDRKGLSFVFGGTLEGTASKISLKELELNYLPMLESAIVNREFELKVIGEVDRHTVDYFSNMSDKIKFTGVVQSFEAELSKSHIFLLPGNYPVGVRTRVCSALAAGCVVIADRAITINMPELSLCGSVFLMNDYAEFSEVLNEMLIDFDFEVSELVSKNFFMRHYAAEVSAQTLIS